jgi:uncharacterized protein
MADSATGTPDGPVVTNDVDGERFVVSVGGELAGYAMYHRIGENRDFTHTEIDNRFEGQGLGSTLIRTALDATRAEGLGVIPHCPFVRRFLQRHHEYVDLVPEKRRAEFGLDT